jgi:starch-binding outer membrane protein, SusD/RagB family
MGKISMIRVTFLLSLGLQAGACHKSFLDQKPSTDLLIPNTMPVLQELMDNTQVMNISPALGEFSADNFYLTYSTWLSLDIKEANAYIWASNIYEGQGLVIDWDIPYQQVFYSNTVLQGLAGIQPDSTNQTQWNMLEGTALFSRAFAFFNVAGLFAEPYDSATAASDLLGIPLRLDPDINEKTTRSSVQATYTQILGDLHTAEGLLPAAIPFGNLNRPSRLAAQALLARVYLSVGDYTDAGLCADSVLQVYWKLLNYNSLDTSKPFQFANNIPEILYQANFPFLGNTLQGLTCGGCLVDTMLVASYEPNDLRRPLYYYEEASGGYTLNGSYAGLIYPFSGLATDELYLIRAECNARIGQVTLALNDLDTLMSHRVVTGSFTPYPVMTAAAALDTVLAERRKELAFRGIRWSDLRRLNQEGWNITLTRNLNGTPYTLLPNSELYTLPIPPDVIQASGIAQNPR